MELRDRIRWARSIVFAANATGHSLKEPPPFVLQTSLDDSYVSYELNAYTDSPGMMAVICSDLHAKIQDAFNAAGIEIMSPQYAAIRDGNASTIPPEQLPSTYVPPSFRVKTASGRDEDLARPGS